MSLALPEMKRPDARGNAVGPVSLEIPSQEISMNSHTDTTSTTPAASEERDSLAPRGPLTNTVAMAVLRELDMKQAFDVRDVMHMLGDILGGVLCQPRFSDNNNNYNRAGDLLSDLADHFSAVEQAIFNIVADSDLPDTEAEAKWRAWTLVSFEADMTDELSKLAVLVTEGAHDQQMAREQERHRARTGKREAA